MRAGRSTRALAETWTATGALGCATGVAVSAGAALCAIMRRAAVKLMRNGYCAIYHFHKHTVNAVPMRDSGG